jgi:hypothetical protein
MSNGSEIVQAFAALENEPLTSRVIVAPRIRARRDDWSFRHWTTVRAFAAISYRFLVRAMFLNC